MRILTLLCFLMFMLTGTVYALPTGHACAGGVCIKCHELTVKEAASLLSFTGAEIKSIKLAPVMGLHEVLFYKNSKQGVVYIDFNKKYLIQGVVIDLKTKVQEFSHDVFL